MLGGTLLRDNRQRIIDFATEEPIADGVYYLQGRRCRRASCTMGRT